jgi:hypothetical protein
MDSRRSILAWIGFAILLHLSSLIVPAQAQDTSWTEPVRLSDEKWAWFPVAAVDPSGVVHVAWSCTRAEGDQAEKPDALFYTRWDGVSWSPPVDVLLSPEGRPIQNPAMAADMVGNLHIIWTDSLSLFYSQARASDAGTALAWMPPIALAYVGYGAATIAADGTGTVHVVYPDPDTGVYYLRSFDGGGTWSQPEEIWQASMGHVGASAARVAVDAKGTIHVVWTQIPLPDGYPPLGVFYSQSVNGGETWSAPLQVAGEDYAEGNILTIGEQSVHLTWHGRAGVGGTFHQWSMDGGQTWSVPTKLLEGGGITREPALAIDSAGVVHLAAVGSEGISYTYWQDGKWAMPMTVEATTVNGIFYEPHHATLVVSRGNHLVLVWTRQGIGEIAYTTRRTRAPDIIPQLLSTPTSEPAVVLFPTAASISGSTMEPSRTPTAPSYLNPQSTISASNHQGALPILAAVIPATLVVATVVLARLLRGSRR